MVCRRFGMVKNSNYKVGRSQVTTDSLFCSWEYLPSTLDDHRGCCPISGFQTSLESIVAESDSFAVGFVMFK